MDHYVPSPDYFAIELAARLIVLQLLTDAIAALEHDVPPVNA